MITVSPEFQTAVYGADRKSYAKVEFQILDVDANTDATASVTSEEDYSLKAQLYNQVRQPSRKYLTGEPGYTMLDGSFTLPPKPGVETGFEIGWVSNLIGEVDKTFSTPQVITSQFTVDHSSIGISITFDKLTGEYAEDFDIEVYDSGASLIESVSVTGNNTAKYIWNQSLTNYRQVVITINKWSVAQRRARIAEIDFGIIQEYEGDQLISVKLLEQLDPISNTLPSDEFSFTLDNQDKSFNILNPSGIYAYLQRKQRIIPSIGIELEDDSIEYVQLGVFYLDDWVSNEGTLTATFIAKDLLDLMARDDFAETTYASKTLEYILDDIMTKLGVTDYTVDASLAAITVSGTLPDSDYREAVQTVLIAGMSTVRSNRDGTLVFGPLSAGSPVDTISFDNVYSPPKVGLKKLYNTITVLYGGIPYTLVDPEKPADEQTLLAEVDNPLIGDLSHATDVAAWLLGELKVRFLYEINWRQNPSLEPGDLVTVEDEFGENLDIRITSSEIDFQGALKGKTKGQGG